MSVLPEMKTIHDLSGFEKKLNHGYRRDMIALFVLVALAGAIVMTFSHRYGPWVDADAVESIVAARNLAWGNGHTVSTAEGYAMPYGFRPPLYSFFLTMIFLLNLDMFIVVSIFNVLLFGGILFLLSWGLWRVMDSLLMSLGITALFSLTPYLFRNFDGTTSYGLFTFLVVANLISLVFFFQEENRRPYLWALLTAALAFFTNFIGGACILAGGLMILVFSEKNRWRKLLHAAIYSFGAALPLIIWQVVHLLQPTQVEMRAKAMSVSFGSALSTYLRQLVNLFVEWLPAQPGWISVWLQTKEAFFVIGIFALGLYGVVVWRYVHHQNTEHRRWMILQTLCLFFIISAIALIFSESYVQTRNAPELTLMMLAPLYPFLIIFVFGSMLALISSYDLTLSALILPLGLGLIFILVNLRPTFTYVQSRYASGSLYTTPQWQNSELLYTVNTTSALRTYFTNDPSGVLLYSIWTPYDISQYDYEIPFLEQNAYYSEQFTNWNGTLLLFQPSYMNPEAFYDPPIDFSTFTQGLKQIYRGTDGEIYIPNDE